MFPQTVSRAGVFQKSSLAVLDQWAQASPIGRPPQNPISPRIGTWNEGPSHCLLALPTVYHQELTIAVHMLQWVVDEVCLHKINLAQSQDHQAPELHQSHLSIRYLSGDATSPSLQGQVQVNTHSTRPAFRSRTRASGACQAVTSISHLYRTWEGQQRSQDMMSISSIPAPEWPPLTCPTDALRSAQQTQAHTWPCKRCNLPVHG